MIQNKKKIRYILGVQSFANADSGACILRFSEDGKILDFVAISEERLIRKKFPYTFPIHSIGYCMDYYNIKSLSEIDLLVSDYIRKDRWFISGPSFNVSDFDYKKIKFDFDPKKIITIRHHLAHAASVYYTSGFDNAATLILDGNGSELETTTYYFCIGNEITTKESYRARGIGIAYGQVTSRILNLGTGGEGKTMGLAPYGKDHPKVLKISGELDGIKNNFAKFMKRMPFSDVLNQIDEKNRIYPFKTEYKKCQNKDELLQPYFSRVAYDIQEETERVMKHLASDIYHKTNSKNLCVAGGVALNSVANKKMFDSSNFEKIFVFPACSDAGIPFGLAMWGYYNAPQFKETRKGKIQFKHAYTGKTYSAEHIQKMFQRFKINYKKTNVKHIANLLSQGKIIGWFQGGSEYGPRSLGHRSILADPRDPTMKDILNIKVKHRETFRPFAPSVLLENCEEFFDLECESPFMLLVADVKKPNIVPAITHVDGTARVQTVTKEDNGRFFDLIQEFKNQTGVPMILNTSFNDAGEPIVETPEDAMICFCNTDMDYLVLEDFIIDAVSIDKKNIVKEMEIERSKRIKENEQELISKLLKNYDNNEKDVFINECNKMAEWNAKYRSKYELEKKIEEWKKYNKKILIVGTIDHIELLLKKINGFYALNIVGYVNYEADSEVNSTELPFSRYELDEIKNYSLYDDILISSYEYMYEILDLLESYDIKKPIYQIYDDSSRDLANVLDKQPEFQVNC